MDLPLDQYGAAHSAVAFLDLSKRGKLRVSGPDRISFFHAIITNDVEGIPVGSGRYGALLTHRGRMVSDFFYYKLPEEILVDLPPGTLERVARTLEGYIIMDDVGVEDVSSQWGHWGLVGPRSRPLLTALFPGYSPGEPYQMQQLEWGGAAVRVIDKQQVTSDHVEILSPSHLSTGLEAALFEQGNALGLSRLGDEAWKTLRLEAGVPEFGVEMDERRYPMEAQIPSAISLTKGCFVGQEVVAKATHVGGVNNLLVALKLSGDSVPEEGSVVCDESGRAIGSVASAVFSPENKAPLALAYLRTASASTGNACKVRSGKGAEIPAVVVERPLKRD